MTNQCPISLVDPDAHRRAQIVYLLASTGRHVEPYDSIDELLPFARRPGLYIVYDSNDLVSQVAQFVEPGKFPALLVVYSENPEIQSVVRAMRAGASNYFAFRDADAAMVDIVKSAETTLAAEMAKDQRWNDASSRVQDLTNRERQVLQCVALGHSNRSIASELGISPRTVEIHRANMLVKLNAQNSPEAVRIAILSGLVA